MIPCSSPGHDPTDLLCCIIVGKAPQVIPCSSPGHDPTDLLCCIIVGPALLLLLAPKGTVGNKLSLCYSFGHVEMNLLSVIHFRIPTNGAPQGKASALQSLVMAPEGTTVGGQRTGRPQILNNIAAPPRT